MGCPVTINATKRCRNSHSSHRVNRWHKKTPGRQFGICRFRKKIDNITWTECNVEFEIVDIPSAKSTALEATATPEPHAAPPAKCLGATGFSASPSRLFLPNKLPHHRQSILSCHADLDPAAGFSPPWTINFNISYHTHAHHHCFVNLYFTRKAELTLKPTTRIWHLKPNSSMDCFPVHTAPALTRRLIVTAVCVAGVCVCCQS
jgi:hypothetical protein